MNNPSQSLLSVRMSANYGRSAVLRNVSLDIQPGEILGLVGQSGSGKSTLALAILGLLGMKQGTATGEIEFKGRNLVQLPQRELRKIRGKEIALVLQSPLSSLNPALKIGTQLREAWGAHADDSTLSWDAAVRTAIKSVSLPDDGEFLARRPGEISVGQAQRVLIAMAIIHSPSLLVADEATSALDVITQSEILALFARLNQQTKMSILYISHDLLSVAGICHRIAILHQGEIVECELSENIFTNPQHPYTQQLVAAMPHRPLISEASLVRAACSGNK